MAVPRGTHVCRSCGTAHSTYLEMMECACLVVQCYICGDVDDHDGVPHGIATGDNRTRADKDREDEQYAEAEAEAYDPRCTCTHLRHHGAEPDKRCSNPESNGGLCVPCIFGCSD